ncbi:response regulator transcription factor [Crassaminicella profunda]|uniref:response regulator transcription factor n=1 Tax=Crassaminicella profunda TaxID=1286698 RepID=UPI001CA70CEC|nr:response regulator transcription factor [Crassaminicella profunda]QZY56091.1 response regulator transcription factor [Crassaminicella profunda]
MAKEKILIVDDELQIQELIRMYLIKEDFEVICASNGNEACLLALQEKPDLIILDILMPELDGLETCTKLRKTTDVPILFLSCKNQDIDKILGLSVGGDDYVTKPFSPSVLIARVKAHLRRNRLLSENKVEKQFLRYPGLEIDIASHSVFVNHALISLTTKEFDLLVFLAKHPNRVFYTSQIFEKIWDDHSFEKDARTVMVHISNLRKKIEKNPTKPQYIITVRGVGYKFGGSFSSMQNYTPLYKNCASCHYQ